jgi:hypothetical protein
MEFTSNLISFVLSESFFFMKFCFIESIPMVYHKHLFTFLEEKLRVPAIILVKCIFTLPYLLMNPPNMNVTLWAWVIECPVLATGQLLNSLLVLYRLYEPT